MGRLRPLVEKGEGLARWHPIPAEMGGSRQQVASGTWAVFILSHCLRDQGGGVRTVTPESSQFVLERWNVVWNCTGLPSPSCKI